MLEIGGMETLYIDKFCCSPTYEKKDSNTTVDGRLPGPAGPDGLARTL